VSRRPAETRAAQRRQFSSRRAFTLVEVSIVVAVMAILIAVALPLMQTGEVELLRSAGDLLASDLRLAQSLAIRDGDNYTLTLAPDGWKIEYSGAGLAPELPKPLLGGNGTGYQVRVALFTGRPVALAARTAQTNTTVTGITFTATGRTAASEDTRFWLTAGTGPNSRSLPLTVTAATGLITAGDLITGPPS
jgi:prepilin-type N-terminal cleavage/methylation domain-containing protein